jgi:ubiquinol-cytochrome c reductase iron-sulfur subunit
MSNEIQKFQDPGLPEHVHRKSDVDPKAADRAERQVSILFVLSALSTVLAIYAYVFIKDDVFFFLPIMGSTNAHQLFLGLGMALALLFIGLGLVHWAKHLMPDTEVIAERHEFRSPDEDREDFVRTVKEQAGAAGLGRRSLIKRTLGLALGASALTPIVLLRDLGPLPGKELEKTSWKTGTRLVTDPGDRPIRPEDL